MLDVYLPDDVTKMPRYKIGNRFYRVVDLQIVPEEPSSIAFRMTPGVLNSAPILVRKSDAPEWILLDTNQDQLRIVGHSNGFTGSGPLMNSIEFMIPRVLEDGTEIGFLVMNVAPFNPVIKRRIDNAIILYTTFPTPNSTMASDPLLSMHFAFSIDLPRTENLQNNTIEKELHQLSYETLIKQLYGLLVEIPEFLILNGLKVNFILFSEISTIQINNYIIEPLLQPWAGPPGNSPIGELPNRILTVFGKNGMTYLVKAKYDQINNQIYPPV